jgi:ribonuclease HI
LKTAEYSNIEPRTLESFLQREVSIKKSEMYNDLFFSSDSYEATIYIDGGSRGNPGDAGIGIVIENGNERYGYYQYIGITTNNEAEYMALIHALIIAKDKNYKNIRVFSDSELITKQINGEYRVKNENLIKLYYDVRNLISKFDQFKISHIVREKNIDADRLANIAMDKKNREQIEIKL